eukprot:scaffold2501_cov113-Isochrysis_galbana.AAC.11
MGRGRGSDRTAMDRGCLAKSPLACSAPYSLERREAHRARQETQLLQQKQELTHPFPPTLLYGLSMFNMRTRMVRVRGRGAQASSLMRWAGGAF